jgi:hypothetical protein
MSLYRIRPVDLVTKQYTCSVVIDLQACIKGRSKGGSGNTTVKKGRSQKSLHIFSE